MSTELVTLASTTNPVLAYLATLPSDKSRRVMFSKLNTIAGLMTGGECDAMAVTWQALRYEHTVAIYSRLVETYPPGTVNHTISALRGVLKACETLGLMAFDEFRRATNLKRVKGETLIAGRELSPEEVAALLRTCWNQTTPAGVRDAAIISLMYQCGPRRDEVVRLAIADYDRENGRLVITGKGRKERTAWATGGARDALGDWLAMRGPKDGALFCRVDKWGKVYPSDSLTGQAVYKMLSVRGRLAGLKHFSPHDLRRTCVSAMLGAGVDLATVSKVVGHADPKTTARYDRRPDESKQAASSAIRVPYRQG